MREKDVLMFIKEKFDHDITSGWFNCFFIRHIDVLEKVHSTPQDDKRLSVPREFLREHLVNVYKNVEGSCIDLVLKIDEDRKPFKVIVDKNFDGDSIEHSVQRIIPHITMLACIAVSGASMTPLIITKRMISEKIWNSGVRKNEEVIRQRDSLYINEQLFLEYLNLVVISYVKVAHLKLRKPFEDAVLMMDSCSYHFFYQK